MRAALQTAIYYMNQDWEKRDGGELRIWGNGLVEDAEPLSDRLVVFFSDMVEPLFSYFYFSFFLFLSLPCLSQRRNQ